MMNSANGMLYHDLTCNGLITVMMEKIPMYKAVHVSRLYEQIVQQIEASIREGQLKPGDQLPAERELAEQFGVSRTAVREAVKTLSEKGLVEAYSGRGTFVTFGKSQSARQAHGYFVNSGGAANSNYVAEVREILEPEFTALAAQRIDEQQLTMMRDAVAAMDRNMQNPDAYIEADLDFHLAMAEAAGNPFILSLLDSIVGILREQRIGIFNVVGGPERGQFHHRQILAAIEARDPERAREAMRVHLKQVREDASASAAQGDGMRTRPT